MIIKNIFLSIVVLSLSGFVTYSITYSGINHMVFAQQDTDPTSPPTTGDNMTSGDNSTDAGAAPNPGNDNGMNPVGSTPDLGLPPSNMSGNVQPDQNTMSQNMTMQGVTTQNMTVQSMPSQATPEFGPVAILVLIIAIISIVAVSSRSKLGFRN